MKAIGNGDTHGTARSRRRPLRAVSLVILLLGFLGCTSPPPNSRLTLVTRSPQVVLPEMLRWRVRGESCFRENVITVTLRPPWRARFADTGRAIEDALAKVPGANVLTNIKISARVEQYLLYQRICAIVVGDAGRIQ